MEKNNQSLSGNKFGLPTRLILPLEGQALEYFCTSTNKCLDDSERVCGDDEGNACQAGQWGGLIMLNWTPAYVAKEAVHLLFRLQHFNLKLIVVSRFSYPFSLSLWSISIYIGSFIRQTNSPPTKSIAMMSVVFINCTTSCLSIQLLTRRETDDKYHILLVSALTAHYWTFISSRVHIISSPNSRALFSAQKSILEHSVRKYSGNTSRLSIRMNFCSTHDGSSTMSHLDSSLNWKPSNIHIGAREPLFPPGGVGRTFKSFPRRGFVGALLLQAENVPETIRPVKIGWWVLEVMRIQNQKGLSSSRMWVELSGRYKVPSP
ncbi:uncharacterized protein BDR25DRAFT_355526 [Lindgomyces ingoldianus]|uniref:Uncharacterized protein n=1 Tax=Lindgomyces ingoldianus TaxID=673940 RepID=A0ACB6QWG7_9PLEO|nr:uncharacterized protein BDR25DRAFT_355526 [Lindgomyces ingoldianus]KAF2470420.1 hypothetical protein BDR25DRAFT_355526 [Lindgomyces ingoldianus]